MFAMAMCLSALPAGAQTLPDLIPSSASLLDTVPLFAPIAVEGSRSTVLLDGADSEPTDALTLLQISFLGLQAMDVVSTVRAVNGGHTEGNPLMRGLSSSPLAMTGVKAGAAASTLLLARHVARKNRTAGVVLLAAVNTALSIVVVRNLRAAGRP
jgi:hypothetical protein